MNRALNKLHPNEFYCRECRFYNVFQVKDDIVSHYMSHIRFLENLIRDIDKEFVKVETVAGDLFDSSLKIFES